MGRRAVETDNRRVHRVISKMHADALSKRHPRIVGIIKATVDQQLPRKLSCDVLLGVLRTCPVITTRAAADATGNRYARSTIAEYAMLARKASAGIADYLRSQ